MGVTEVTPAQILLSLCSESFETVQREGCRHSAKGVILPAGENQGQLCGGLAGLHEVAFLSHGEDIQGQEKQMLRPEERDGVKVGPGRERETGERARGRMH